MGGQGPGPAPACQPLAGAISTRSIGKRWREQLPGLVNQGAIAQEGTAESLYRQPASDFVAQFIGRTNLLAARVLGVEADAIVLEVDCRCRGRAPVGVSPPRLGDPGHAGFRGIDLGEPGTRPVAERAH